MPRSIYSIKTDALIRKLMCQYFSAALKLYIVTEYPKSGGTWFSQLLSELLELPLYRNRFPKLTSQVVHGHYRYHPKMQNVFCVIRDGRDIIVSYYYHSLFLRADQLNFFEVKTTTRSLNILDPDDIKKNLPRFIEYKFTAKELPRFSWSEFVDDWVNKNVPIIRYEELLNNPVTTIKNALISSSIELPKDTKIIEIIDKFSFKNISGREKGQEDKTSFLRKGVAGDWKSKFSLEANQVFNYYAGDNLINLGYEQDRSWAYKLYE